MIIGITGQPAAGKDTAASRLEEHGFLHVSTGDFLRQQLKKQGGEPTSRQAVSDFAKAMREKYGAGYPTTELLKKFAGKDIVLSGLRQIVEIETLRSQKDERFVLIAPSAPIEKRYAWARARGREGDDVSFEEFKRMEDYERAGVAQQVDAVLAMADLIIENDGTIDDLKQKIDEALSGFRSNQS